MPLAKLQVSVEVDEGKKKELLASLSKVVAEVTGKLESYVMVTLEKGDIAMAGQPGPAAFVDVRGIGGFDGATNKRLSEEICKLLSGLLGIEGARIYITFTDVAASNWGWDGKTLVDD